MAGDPLPRQVGGGKFAQDQRRQLILDIGAHAIMFRPRLLGRIAIEAGAEAEIPCFVGVVGNPLPAWAGVGGDEDDAVQRAGGAIFALFHYIGVGDRKCTSEPQALMSISYAVF